MTVLVTGAYGLVGFWLVAALLERDDHVVVLKRSDGAASALVREGLEERCTVLRGDVTDGHAVEAATRGVDTVFHLAAQTLVGVAKGSPVGTFETNVMGTLNVLEAARAQGIRRTVVAGSDQAYGPHASMPYREDYALRSEHPYGVSKAAADMLARSYWHTYEMPVAVARLPNIYGGGDANGSRLVPGIMSAVLDGRSPVIRSDGSPERDFLHASDAARAYLAIAAALDGGGAAGEAFNAGGERPHSVREVVELLIEAAGSDVAADYQGDGVPPGEVDRQFLDSSKLRALTGWRPEVTLEDGLRRTYEWYAERRA